MTRSHSRIALQTMAAHASINAALQVDLGSACSWTAREGTVSRLVPQLDGRVTTPRNDTHIVVTERGWVDLKPKTLCERAEALIGIAHPRFRDEPARPAP